MNFRVPKPMFIFASIFAAFALCHCDDDVACDPQIYEEHCKGNVFYSCRQHSDERNYTDAYTVHSATCPSTHRYCLTEPYGVGCSITKDAGYCGQYPAGPIGYCEANAYTECESGVVSAKNDCPAELELFCTSDGCEALPDAREAEIGQPCTEVCGDVGPQAFHVMGPFPGAPEEPFQVTVATASGVLEALDGEKAYFKNYLEPPEGLENLENITKQLCYCGLQAP